MGKTGEFMWRFPGCIAETFIREAAQGKDQGDPMRQSATVKSGTGGAFSKGTNGVR